MKVSNIADAFMLGIILAILEAVFIKMSMGLTLNPRDELVVTYFILQALVIYYSLYKLKISPLDDYIVKWF